MNEEQMEDYLCDHWESIREDQYDSRQKDSWLREHYINLFMAIQKNVPPEWG